MSKPETLVKDLINIGPKTARLLQEIGISTKKELMDMGPVMAYKILQHRFRGVNVIALYALYGAVHDIHWNSISPQIKKQLRNQAKDMLDVDLK